MSRHGVSSDSSRATPFLGMTRGEGENSYAKNSNMQAKLMKRILPIFFDAIKSMTLPVSTDPAVKVFRIADLGCSSSRNTIANVEAIIEQVRARYAAEEGTHNYAPEFQAFFQDLHTNDFNTLFKHLFSQPNAGIEKKQDYMSAAVPGSFCNRLFPKSTINIALSTFALHWLAQVPDAVLDRQSPAYNGGHTDLNRSRLATLKAYAEQAEKELDDFLAARAHEIVSGGLLFLTFMVRQTEFYPYYLDPAMHAQEEVWNALVLEGSVSEDLRYSYNEPHYCRTLEEVNKLLQKYSSVFEVQKQELLCLNYDSFLKDSSDLREIARRRVKFTQGLSAGYIEAHFGKEVTNLFFERFEQVVHELFNRLKSDMEQEVAEEPPMVHILTLSLRRM